MTARPFNLDKRNGKIMGVAAGVADRLDVDVTFVRVAFVLLALSIAHGFGVLLYLLVGLVARDRAQD